MTTDYQAVVVGGGFFGCQLALYLRRRLSRVLLVEKHADLLLRASYNNQARVHNGYHYPRSFLTALRCRIHFTRFVTEYHECIQRQFAKYYAVARKLSKVTANQFVTFCQRIGAPLAPAPEEVRRHFNPELIEAVFAVQEYAFDAVRLREVLRRQLDQAGVEVRTGTTVDRAEPAAPDRIRLLCRGPGGETIRAEQVFVCTYSQLNQLLAASGLPVIPLKHELTELALVKPPPALQGWGITVVCGPFFSCMPFPARGLHTLSHVRYTPHLAWMDGTDAQAVLDRAPRRTNYPAMLRDACRYMPVLVGCQYVDSLWEVKTVLPVSETSDSRPILLKRHQGLPNLHCVLGAKIDTIYDALEAVDELVRPAEGKVA